MNHQAVEDAVTPGKAPEDAGEFSLLTFSPAFRDAIRASLRAETAVEIRVEELWPPSARPYPPSASSPFRAVP